MSVLLETIRCVNGVALYLEYHQKRVDESRIALFDTNHSLVLRDYIAPPKHGVFRCRIVYSRTIHTIEYLPYLPKSIRTLQIVSSIISYDYKFADRSSLEALKKKYPKADDIVIEKDGFITDTSIANLAFFDGKVWFTPDKPLLEGTTRKRLLESGFLTPRAIKKEDLGYFKNVSLMNAMIGFHPIKSIFFL